MNQGMPHRSFSQIKRNLSKRSYKRQEDIERHELRVVQEANKERYQVRHFSILFYSFIQYLTISN